MENAHLNDSENQHSVPETPVTEEPGYTPRPAWQVWVARVGLVLFIIVVILYYLQLFRGVI